MKFMIIERCMFVCFSVYNIYFINDIIWKKFLRNIVFCINYIYDYVNFFIVFKIVFGDFI